MNPEMGFLRIEYFTCIVMVGLWDLLTHNRINEKREKRRKKPTTKAMI